MKPTNTKDHDTSPESPAPPENTQSQSAQPGAHAAPAQPSPPRYRHRRTGKIARLPKSTREDINLMLTDGLPYAEIIEKLALAAKGINEDNLSRWHTGGYQDWLKFQTWLTEMHAKLDFASEVLHEAGNAKVHEASLSIAIAQLYGLLITFDPAALSDKLAADPASYIGLLNALSKITNGALNYERANQKFSWA